MCASDSMPLTSSGSYPRRMYDGLGGCCVLCTLSVWWLGDGDYSICICVLACLDCGGVAALISAGTWVWGVCVYSIRGFATSITPQLVFSSRVWHIRGDAIAGNAHR